MIDEDRSARDLICSDQLKPSPENLSRTVSYIASKSLIFLQIKNKRRSLLERDESGLLETVPLKFPVPVFTSRSALAPKLIRRAKGEDGDSFGAASPSSTALSSMEADGDVLLETLSCLALTPAKADAWVGEPERPRDVIDIRRRC